MWCILYINFPNLKKIYIPLFLNYLCKVFFFTFLYFRINYAMYFSVTRRVPLVEQELLTIPEHLSSPFFSGVHVTRSIVFCVMFCRSLFVLLSFFFFSLCCLFFDLRIMIIPLVSSKSLHLNFPRFYCDAVHIYMLRYLCDSCCIFIFPYQWSERMDATCYVPESVVHCILFF